ncbi:BTB/POZ domain-containing protein [Aspergillus stella-maris]|uniref:BTB/POZ domain-containing protein n=1 Tax=Aspergillus stella-maris TaxID=1810926 RepID=UPI003CCD5879
MSPQTATNASANNAKANVNANNGAEGTAPIVQDRMKTLFQTGEYSDMTIICKNATFKVHRSILCPQSDFFKMAMAGNFKESQTQTINLPDDEPKTIERVLSFLYCGYYKDDGHIKDLGIGPANAPSPAPVPKLSEKLEGKGENAPNTVNKDTAKETPRTKNKTAGKGVPTKACIHLKVYIAADKYNILPLKETAAERFKGWCSRYWNSERLIAISQYALTTLPSHDITVRDIIASVIAAHMDVLSKNKAILGLLAEETAIASLVLAKLIKDDIIWNWQKECNVTMMLNAAVKGRKCGGCFEEGPWVKIEADDIAKSRFRCSKCDKIYDAAQYCKRFD